MKKSLITLTVAIAAFALIGGVPLRWTVETSKVQPAVFEVVHGEEIDLAAVLQSYGKPLDLTGETAHIYWQTNGMEQAWWVGVATVTSNRIEATFAPEMDPGAASVVGFLGIEGENYRAAFQLRFRHGPGATVNEIEPPVRTLDFARVVVTNAPWATPGDIADEAEARADADATLGNAIAAKADQAALSSLSNRVEQLTGGAVTESDVREIVTAQNPFQKSADGTFFRTDSDLRFNGNNTRFNNAEIHYGNENHFGAEFHHDAVTHYGAFNWYGGGTFDVGTGYGGIVRFYEEIPLQFYSGSFYHSAPDATIKLANSVLCLNGVPIATTQDVVGKADTTNVYTKAETDAIVADATPGDYATVRSNASSALAYSSGIYRYMIGNTNAWFEGTNYNVNAEQAAGKVRYTPEAWEDVVYTPPSLQLYEIRDGARKCVWDQRDWTVYYWQFKAAQLSNNFERVTHNLETNKMTRGWAKYTAVNGLDNPATDTLWIDTTKITIAAGMQWQKMVEAGGTAYYTITGNGITLGPEITEEGAFLTFKDFEGNAVLTLRKTAAQLIYCETGTDIVAPTYMDAQGRIVFHFTTNVQPTGEFSATLEDAEFIEEGESDCPANVTWTGSSGSYDCHFIAKDPDATACFARFKVTREGENVVEYSIPIKINDGIIFEQNGVTHKIRPSVSGSTVTWSVVQ